MMKNQQGFSLIEVLVALLILAIGLLGHMALQMTSLSSNQSSYNRSQAAIAANEIADRMRNNVLGVKGNGYDNITTASAHTDPACNTSSSGCNAAQISQLNLYEWKQTLENAIPSGVGTITRDAAASTANQAVYTISISWNAPDKVGLPNATTVGRITMDIGIWFP